MQTRACSCVQIKLIIGARYNVLVGKAVKSVQRRRRVTDYVSRLSGSPSNMPCPVPPDVAEKEHAIATGLQMRLTHGLTDFDGQPMTLNSGQAVKSFTNLAKWMGEENARASARAKAAKAGTN